ncbi:DUF1934 domain-containing protein [Bacillus infantis]|nr:DUF1934 domain-containing protein [Bacillus infantis]MCP1160838.1 DUF1934 domain-containing protein [Bacillus infantis]PLR73408.1 DUF1934 domain-containing protein [Bacillus sp. UMB0728]
MLNSPAEQTPVKIKVKTDIRSGGSKETFELTAFGRYYKKNGSRFLQYDEENEAGTVKTIVKMAEGEALILRSGAVKMRLPFRLNKKMRGSYEMPFGTMEMLTLTKGLSQSFDDNSGTGAFDLLYEMKMQGSQAGTYHLAITFEEEEK